MDVETQTTFTSSQTASDSSAVLVGPSPGNSQTADEGHLTVQGNEQSYVGATHWAAMLDNVNGPLDVAEWD